MSVEYIEMGHYPYTDEGQEVPIKWRFLHDSGKRMLLITEFGIDCLPFYTPMPKPLDKRYFSKEDGLSIEELVNEKSKKVFDKDGNLYKDIYGYPITSKKYRGFPLWYPVTWETSTLRNYLNGEFVKKAFSDDERSSILVVPVSSCPSPLNEAVTGGGTTKDMVFLLNHDSAERYFPLEEDRQCIPTPYADCKSMFHHKDGFCSWWLRTVGLWEQFDPKEEERPQNRHCISVVWNTGRIDLMGMSADTFRCIRPCIMVRKK